MRICHVIEATGGGSARICAELLRDQIARGDFVTLIYSEIRADSWFLQNIYEIKGLNIIKLNMWREISWRDIGSFVKLIKIFKNNSNFDVIHSHSSKAGALARLTGLKNPSKYIHHTHFIPCLLLNLQFMLGLRDF
jgi:hypothetical protein